MQYSVCVTSIKIIQNAHKVKKNVFKDRWMLLCYCKKVSFLDLSLDLQKLLLRTFTLIRVPTWQWNKKNCVMLYLSGKRNYGVTTTKWGTVKTEVADGMKSFCYKYFFAIFQNYIAKNIIPQLFYHFSVGSIKIIIISLPLKNIAVTLYIKNHNISWEFTSILHYLNR